MSNNTSIEWTDITDNIMQVATGGHYCCKVSPGCANCYAEKINQNAWFGGNGRKYAGPAPVMVLRQDIIDGWERMRLPKRHFVCSMTDVFGDWVSHDMATNFLRGMWRAPQQTFQVLTKRPEIALDRILAWLKFDGLSELPPNIWIGTSVENQEWADRRIPILLQIPARVRFLSIEPLLGPIDLTRITDVNRFPWAASFDVLRGRMIHHDDHDNFTASERVHWVIIGGESGSKARKCNVEWISSLVRQAQEGLTACFVKQLGAFPVVSNDFNLRWPEGTRLETNAACTDEILVQLRDKKGGDKSEWPVDLRLRQFPA